MKYLIAYQKRLSVFILVLLCLAGFSQQRLEDGIIYLENGVIGIAPFCDSLVSGSNISRISASSFIYASADQSKELKQVEIEVNELGEVAILTEYTFPIPKLKTDYALDWNWSISPDGKWMVVSRRIAKQHFFPHGLNPEVQKEAKKIHWIGIVNLETNELRKVQFADFKSVQSTHEWRILGWQGSKCLVHIVEGTHKEYEGVYAIDVLNTSKLVEIIQGDFSFLSLSPDGQKLATSTGFDGNIRYALHNLQDSTKRILLDEPNGSNPYRKAYAQGAVLKLKFSNNSEWILVQEKVWGEFDWKVKIALESLDGETVLFEDFYSESDEEFWKSTRGSLLLASPSENDRYAYFKPTESNSYILSIVEVKDKIIEKEEIEITIPPYLVSTLTPVWNYDGSKIAWIDEQNNIVTFNIESHTTRTIGKLDGKMLFGLLGSNTSLH
jgi:hypothetical protein